MSDTGEALNKLSILYTEYVNDIEAIHAIRQRLNDLEAECQKKEEIIN